MGRTSRCCQLAEVVKGAEDLLAPCLIAAAWGAEEGVGELGRSFDERLAFGVGSLLNNRLGAESSPVWCGVLYGVDPCRNQLIDRHMHAIKRRRASVFYCFSCVRWRTVVDHPP
jgi:hypothetical protein